MLVLATVLLGLAASVGAGLAVAALRRRGSPAPGAVALLHGGLAVAGLGLLIAALAGTDARQGEATGTASFGRIAVVVLAAAALVGLAMAAMRWRRRRLSGLVIGAHATLAVTGFVILAVYTLLG